MCFRCPSTSKCVPQTDSSSSTAQLGMLESRNGNPIPPAAMSNEMFRAAWSKARIGIGNESELPRTTSTTAMDRKAIAEENRDGLARRLRCYVVRVLREDRNSCSSLSVNPGANGYEDLCYHILVVYRGFLVERVHRSPHHTTVPVRFSLLFTR
jgi:hypothetical protein